uniref:cAMP responsive element binding protein 1 n=1 Tax=Pavo cristatus TaxID=9049 RepID=A0A8C9EPP8_PAVCR
MTMESGAENQQSGDAAVTEAETQQMTVQAQPQIATLAQVSMPAAHATSSAPTVTLVQLPNGQTVQVHGVIQAAQPSVIQSPQVQTVQVLAEELPNTRIAPSEWSCQNIYTFSHFLLKSLQHTVFARKILNDLSSDAPGVPRIEEEKSEEETAAPAIATVTVPTPIYQTSSGQYSNSVVSFFAAASGDVQTYQIRTAPTSTIAPGVVMASSPALPTQPAEEAARKREVRLMKNRHVHLDHFFFSNSSV